MVLQVKYGGFLPLAHAYMNAHNIRPMCGELNTSCDGYVSVEASSLAVSE